jgi:hypothetical protein
MPQHVDVRDYKELYRKTKVAPAAIRKDVRARLRTCGRIGANTAKVHIRAWPVQGGISAKAGGRMHRGLRARLASQISVSVGGSNVTIRQGRRGLTGNSAADLTRDIDRGGWYHPVYGHLIHQSVSARAAVRVKNKIGIRSLPVRQGKVFQEGWPYFKQPINAKRPEMIAEMSKTLDEIERLLT